MNIENQKVALIGGTSTAADPASAGAGLTGDVFEELSSVCYPAVAENVEGKRLVPTRENTCVNNVCVLKVKDEDSYRVVVGTTLNALAEPNPSELTNFVNALGLDGSRVNCEEGEGFVRCDLPDSSRGAVYDVRSKAIIYGESIAPGLVQRALDSVAEFFASFFGGEPAPIADTSFMDRAENIHDFYFLKEDDHQVRAVKLIEPGKAGIIAEFENYNTYLCPYVEQYVANDNPPIPGLRGELIEENSNGKRLCCTKQGDIQTIQAFVPTDVSSAIHEFWPNLTGRLRIDDIPPGGQPEHGNDAECVIPAFPNPLDLLEAPAVVDPNSPEGRTPPAENPPPAQGAPEPVEE